MVNSKYFIFFYKKVIRRIYSVIFVLVIFCCGLNYFNELLVNKDSQKNYMPFLENEREFDVLFFGSSHVYMGVSPQDLFRDYGITSYNLGMDGNFIASNSYYIKEVLDYLHNESLKMPKAIVLDIYVGKGNPTTSIHRLWDCVPLSRNKIEMVDKLVEVKEKKSMLVPFLLYHNRWNELREEDFLPQKDRLYGMSARGYAVSYPDDEVISDPTDMIEIPVSVKSYIEKIETECAKQNIELILIHIPYTYDPEAQRIANGICQYAETQKIICVNYMNEDTGIDYDIDLYDSGHLNTAGKKIITDELGKLLSGLGMKDHRDGMQETQWQLDYENYIQFKIEKVKEIEDAKIFLMAINDPDLFSTIQIYEGILGDIQISKLIERLREGGHQIIVTEERLKVVSEDGRTNGYDVYCEVYRREDPNTIIYSSGFTI